MTAVKKPFFGLLALGCLIAVAVTWVVLRSSYNSEIESRDKTKIISDATIKSLEATIKNQSEYLSQLRFQTQSKSPEEALKKVDEINAEINSLRRAARACPQLEDSQNRI